MFFCSVLLTNQCVSKKIGWFLSQPLALIDMWPRHGDGSFTDSLRLDRCTTMEKNPRRGVGRSNCATMIPVLGMGGNSVSK